MYHKAIDEDRIVPIFLSDAFQSVYYDLSLKEASKAGNRKKLQAREYNRATDNNLPIPLVPGCEESDNEPKATSIVAALKSTARAMLDCSGSFSPARA